MHTKLLFIDYLLISTFVIFMILIGYFLKKKISDSKDFLLAGRKIPGWVTGIAFISANVSALELLGMSASGAQYGVVTFHFYYVGAIPGMIFLGIFMMPFYYSSKIRSVPEYLRYRFNNHAHLFNSITTLLGMTLGSGIYLYSMALIFEVMFGWNLFFSIAFSATIVLIYTYFGGLSSSIYTEVLQFFLTVFGLLPVVILGLMKNGGWDGVLSRLPETSRHLWKYLPNGNNPQGMDIISVVFGLGFVLSFSYWTCGFAEVQRAMAAKDYSAARRTPLIGAMFKIFLPFVTIVPGIIAFSEVKDVMGTDYNKSFLLMLKTFYPNGMLGLGTTALLASFMAGMSSSVTALNTIFTYDIYQTYLRPNESEDKYLKVGRICTAVSVLSAVFGSFIAMRFNNVMEYIQLLFSFFNAPLIGAFLLGMFWKRASASSAFFGLLLGTLAGILHYALTVTGVLVYKTMMVSNFYGAIYAGAVCFLSIIVVSFLENPKEISELQGLMYFSRDRSQPFWDKKILAWGSILILLLLIFNIYLA